MRDLQKDSVSALPLSQASLTFNACPSIPLLCAGTGVTEGGHVGAWEAQPQGLQDTQPLSQQGLHQSRAEVLTMVPVAVG